VDIQNCGEGGYNLGWVDAGEWLEYTANVARSEYYDLGVRIATQANAKTMYVEVDGVNVTGSIAMPNTGGFQNWQTVMFNNIPLTAGIKVIRIYFEATDINFNYFTFAVSSSPNIAPIVNIISPEMNSTFDEPAEVIIVATASDEGSIARVEFFHGNVKLGEDTELPYNYTWTGLTAGSYIITAKAYDNLNAYSVSEGITFTVIGEATGIISIYNSNTILFPNPAEDVINITGLSEDMKDVQVKVLDVLAKTVLEIQYPSSKIVPIDIKELTSGVYHLTVVTEGKIVLSRTFIKQ
jgi:hypothetical protein